MRLFEFLSPDELQQLEQLIYQNVYKALVTYQQQRAIQQHIATKPTATLKPKVAKRAKALSRKAKRAPHAATPKALPRPKQQPQASAETHAAYRPVKTTTPLPPTTRMAVAKTQPRTNQTAPKPSALNPVMNLGDLDQAARRLLPTDKRGTNPIDLIQPNERG
ncbi:MAG: hypothetical protein RL541_28 [Pseudomonadota bacterium]|jgi:hypothetical protein